MTVLYSDLPPAEQAVLAQIANANDDEWFAHNFKGLSRRTGLSRETVRAACRSLRDKGLAEHLSGLMSEDGEVAGSGYSATPHGSQLYFEARERAP